jgi:hypothetical protein
MKKQGVTEQEAMNLAQLQRTERAVSEYQSVAVDMMQLNPREFARQENYLARTLGIHKRMLGLGDEMTQAGRVKLQLADMKATAQNLIDVTARYAFKKTTNEAITDIHALLKQRGVDIDTAKEFINNAGEVAKSPRQRVAYGNTDAVNKQILKRHNDMMDEASKLGLSAGDMDIIVDRLTKSMSVIDDTHAMAKVLGADSVTVDNVGYMVRTFTDKAEKFFKLKSVDTAQWSTRAVGTSSVQRSRESWSLIPEDYEVLAQYLVPGKYKQWNDTVSDLTENTWSYTKLLQLHKGDEVAALDNLAELTGKSLDELDALRFGGLDGMVNDIHKMAEDGQALTQYLHKNLTAQQLDELVDAGVLHKLEMTTRELADYISRQYDLPYQKALGMFEMDLGTRIDKYAASLRKSAGESNIIKTLLTQGTEKGWTIPTALMTDEHKGFVKLSGIDLTRFGLNPKLADEWKGVHVHPTVHAQLQSYLELSTNPGKLAQFANVWSYVLRNFNVTTLASNGVPFLSRNVIAGTINFLAGGGNLARVIPGIHEYASVIGKGGLESLDDTMKIVRYPGTGELLTKRETFKRMFIKRGTDYVSQQTGNVMGLNKTSTSSAKRVIEYAGQVLPVTALPSAVRKQLEYARYMGEGWGLKEAAKLGTEQLDDYVRTVFAPIAYGNSVVDGGFKWAWTMTHLGSTGKLDDFGKFIMGGKTFKDSEELFDTMDNFFINANTQGTLQKGLAKYVVPFGQFAMASTPMAIRHAIRNPSQFMAYNRLIRMNHRENMRDPDVRESGFSEFELAALPMTLFKDYKNPGQVLTLFPTNVDMYQSSLAYLGKQTQRVGRLVNEGGFVGQGDKDRKQLRDPYSLGDFMKDNLKDNQNPVFGIVSEFLSGKDSMGRDIEKNTRPEVGGVAINPSVFWILSKLPGFSSVNSSINGRGAVTAPDGTIQAPPQAGLFGTPQREATRTEEARYRAGQFVGTEAYSVIRNVLGLDVRTIDLAEGRQHTLKDIKFTISTLTKRANELKASVDGSPEKQSQLEVVGNQILQLKVDEHRVGQWLKSNNVPEPQALKKLQLNGITVRSLPVNDAKVQQYINEYLQLTTQK